MDLPTNSFPYHSKLLREEQTRNLTADNSPGNKRPLFYTKFGDKQGLLQSPLYQKGTPATFLRSDERYDLTGDQKSLHKRENVQVLSEHLKSVSIAKKQVEERYNRLKSKMDDELASKNDEIANLKNFIHHAQKSQNALIQKLEFDIKNGESIKSQLAKKDSQISTLSHRVQSQQRQLNRFQKILRQKQGQLANSQASYQLLSKQNLSLKQTVEFQKRRIDQFNAQVAKTHKYSDHLFFETNETKLLEKNRINQQMETNEIERMLLEKNIREMDKTCDAYEIKCQELKIGQDILDERNIQLIQMHAKLQQENLQISRINTDLIMQIERLNHQVNGLKQLCFGQQTRETQLLANIKSSEDEICSLKKALKKEAVSKIRKDVHDQIQRAKNSDRIIQPQIEQTSTPNKKIPQNNHPGLMNKSNPNDKNEWLNYLTGPKNQTQSIFATKESNPYNQYLSFKPSQPYQPANPSQNAPKPYEHRFGDDSNQKDRDSIDRAKYNRSPSYNSNDNGRQSRSFYGERNNALMSDPDNVFKSLFNSREKSNHSVKNLRNSLDLRRKSLELHSMFKTSRNEVLNNPKHTKPHQFFKQKSNQPKFTHENNMLGSKPSYSKGPEQALIEQTPQRSGILQLMLPKDQVMGAYSPVQNVIGQNNSIQKQNNKNFGLSDPNQIIQEKLWKQGNNGSSQRMKESRVEKFSLGRGKTDWTGRNNDLVHNLWNKAIYK